MNGIINLEFDGLKARNLDQLERWNDWYFVVNFMNKGKEYFLTLTINEGTLLGGNGIRLSLSSDPFSIKTEENVKVGVKAVNEITINKRQGKNALKYTENKNLIVIEMDDLTAHCKTNELKIISKNEIIKGELIFTPRGPVFWWGNKKNVQNKITERSDLRGFELLSNVHGKINVKGTEIEINDRGLFEHLWMNSLEFLKIRLEDWIYANFNQLFTFLCHVESNSDDGSPYHYETGTIYVIEENDYLFTKKIEFMPTNWVYLKAAHRFIPLNQKIRVKTDKGTLKMKTTLSLYPQFIGRPRRIEDLTIHNITGWNLMFYDAPITIEGKFFYKNGKTIKLTNGRGLNNVVRNFPLY